MQPLPPELRAALKDAHPGLRDETIDRIETLLSERLLCDPESEQDRIASLDHERKELIRRQVPEYASVARDYAAGLARKGAHDATPIRRVTAKPKGPA